MSAIAKRESVSETATVTTDLDRARLRRKVPTIYEQDESKYAGPHRWQANSIAKLGRRLLRRHAYGRWIDRSFTDINITGQEHLAQVTGPAIFIANHQSHLDTLLVHAAMPERLKRRILFGAAQDRWFVKGRKKLVLKPWYQSLALGNFPIRRGGGKDALAYAEWLLQRSEPIFLFPEGTRATDDALGEFKHGATLLALKLGVPIVPIYLGGCASLRPKGTQQTTKGVGHVHILPPVQFATGSAVAEATEYLRRRLLAAHEAFNSAKTTAPVTKGVAPQKAA